MNRGLARRSAFEDRACVRYFLACLARVVRLGLLEVHAYAILTTHFHLLLRAPTGQLGEGLRLVENRYVRWFNRRVLRDGPLFRGRFCSKRVETLSYRELLVRYIDDNPVKAGLCDTPAAYPHGSAWHYARPSGPKWLTRDWIGQMGPASGRSPQGGLPDTREIVEARLRSSARGLDPLDDLVGAAPERVARWLRRRAELADGPGVSYPCASSEAILSVVALASSGSEGWSLKRGRSRVSAWRPLTAGLLRDLAALRWVESAMRMGLSESAVKRCYQTHRAWMTEDEAYQRAAGTLAKEALPR